TLLALTHMLPEDPNCLKRAFHRVLTKRGPTRKKGGTIKDAYLFEQCITFCQHLRNHGFLDRHDLWSSNTDDVTKPPGRELHDDLASDATPVALEYFTSLFAAIGSLGFVSTPSS